MQYRFLTGNMLKILAAILMTIDHIGMLLFPRVRILRIIGRLAMPIFAFMIAEGCKYTRNRLKYFGMVFVLGIVCQVAYYLFDRSLYFTILITFSLAILITYALQYWKRQQTLLSFLIFAGSVGTVYWLNQVLEIDYGFWGCMLPVLAALPHSTKQDSLWASVACMGIGLVLLAQNSAKIQIYALLALPLLLLYNGKRGTADLKYFFYLFYPSHLVVLQAMAIVVERFR